MKPETPPGKQDDLFRARLVEMIDMRHEPVKLATLIDWDVFDREWGGFFPSHTVRPATPPRLLAGLLYLQHVLALSDEAVVARWAENPCWQHFCGELKGIAGDALFAVLCGCGHNIRMILRQLTALLRPIFRLIIDHCRIIVVKVAPNQRDHIGKMAA